MKKSLEQSTMAYHIKVNNAGVEITGEEFSQHGINKMTLSKGFGHIEIVVTSDVMGDLWLEHERFEKFLEVDKHLGWLAYQKSQRLYQEGRIAIVTKIRNSDFTRKLPYYIISLFDLPSRLDVSSHIDDHVLIKEILSLKSLHHDQWHIESGYDRDIKITSKLFKPDYIDRITIDRCGARYNVGIYYRESMQENAAESMRTALTASGVDTRMRKSSRFYDYYDIDSYHLHMSIPVASCEDSLRKIFQIVCQSDSSCLLYDSNSLFRELNDALRQLALQQRTSSPRFSCNPNVDQVRQEPIEALESNCSNSISSADCSS